MYSAAVEALNLVEPVKSYAYELLAAFPSVVFTSGRRGRDDQARAMASNVVLNRQWIARTYLGSPVRDACQAWVDANPQATSAADIAAGLLEVLNGFDDEDLSHLSLHLSGQAFDVQPVDGELGEQICAFLQGMATRYCGKFLSREGGLVRWHIQFRVTA